MRGFVVAILGQSSVAFALFTMSVCAVNADPAQSPPEDEVAQIKAKLGLLQRLSFATEREYCGYIGRISDGTLMFTEMVRGGHDGCTPVFPATPITLSASLHTHGAYDAHVPAEFPTSLDMESDTREGVNGYISTPGGRLWFIDSSAGTATQLCGLGCLPQDPDFHAGDDGQIKIQYTYQELLGLESPD